MTLAKKLKSKRVHNSLSLRDLSRIVGISFATLSRIERGAGTPTPGVMNRLERWLSTGAGSSPTQRSRKAESWFVGIDRRLAEIEKRLAALEAP